MGKGPPDTSVSAEVNRIVAAAKRDGGCISASSSAAWVIRIYPDCGLSEREVAEEIIMAAARAGVAVEMGKIPNSDLRSPIR